MFSYSNEPLEEVSVATYVPEEAWKESLTAKGYSIKKTLGKGSFGVVFEVVDRAGKSFAAKIQTKDTDDTSYKFIEKVALELTTCNKVHASNSLFLVPLCAWLIRTPDSMYSVYMMDMLLGTLSDFKKTLKTLNTNDYMPVLLSDIFIQLQILHAHGYAHSDIKGENIFIRYKRIADHPSDIEYSIGDWSLTRKIKDLRANKPKHTSSYLVPEMLPGLTPGNDYTTTSPFGSGMDVYHVAILCMDLLMGRGGYQYANEFLEYLYNQPRRDLILIDLMASMLAPKEDDRITAVDALKHPFVNRRALIVSSFVENDDSGFNPKKLVDFLKHCGFNLGLQIEQDLVLEDKLVNKFSKLCLKEKKFNNELKELGTRPYYAVEYKANNANKTPSKSGKVKDLQGLSPAVWEGHTRSVHQCVYGRCKVLIDSTKLIKMGKECPQPLKGSEHLGDKTVPWLCAQHFKSKGARYFRNNITELSEPHASCLNSDCSHVFPMQETSLNLFCGVGCFRTWCQLN